MTSASHSEEMRELCREGYLLGAMGFAATLVFPVFRLAGERVCGLQQWAIQLAATVHEGWHIGVHGLSAESLSAWFGGLAMTVAPCVVMAMTALLFWLKRSAMRRMRKPAAMLASITAIGLWLGVPVTAGGCPVLMGPAIHHASFTACVCFYSLLIRTKWADETATG